jgi:hypothetical protein
MSAHVPRSRMYMSLNQLLFLCPPKRYNFWSTTTQLCELRFEGVVPLVSIFFQMWSLIFTAKSNQQAEFSESTYCKRKKTYFPLCILFITTLRSFHFLVLIVHYLNEKQNKEHTNDSAYPTSSIIFIFGKEDKLFMFRPNTKRIFSNWRFGSVTQKVIISIDFEKKFSLLIF